MSSDTQPVKSKRQKHPSSNRLSTSVRKAAFLKALGKKMGIIGHACEEIKVDRSTVLKWKAEDEAFRDAMLKTTDQEVDFLASALHGRVEEGDTSAIIFGLKCRGKDRGWSEKKVVEMQGGLDLQLTEGEQKKYDKVDLEKLERIKELLCNDEED